MELEPRGARPALGLQVTLIVLVALLPVVWLVGRRTAPAATSTPLLLGGAATHLQLTASHLGLGADQPPEVTLPAGPGSTVLIEFPLPEGRTPPYQLSLTGPDGGLIWQVVRPDLPVIEGSLQLAVPASLLRGGRNSLVIRDARGMTTSLPFLAR
ncbi:MAG: hypothetical protein Q8R92_02895 [Deltaproteobacteria bacterium]|nr:hypothetical protein [Deltaproteobacteria bacterium]